MRSISVGEEKAMVSRDISIGGVLDGVPRGAGDEEEVLLDEDPVDNEIR